MNKVLAASANSSAGASSLTTGANSVLSGNSNLQRSVSMNTDSLTSSGAASMGLPTSPLSFSSSNVSLSGSSGLGASSLSQAGAGPITRHEAHQDPSIHPTKLLKSVPSHLSQGICQNVLLQQLRKGAEFGTQGPQSQDVHNLGMIHQTVGSNASGLGHGQHLMRSGLQYKGPGLSGLEQEYQSNEQRLAQFHASIAAAKTMRDDLLQQQAAHNVPQRPNPMLAAQLQRHEALQQQSQHAQAQLLHQQRLVQQEQMLRLMPQQLQRSRLLQQQHQLQQQIAGLTKQSASASGACILRLMNFMHHQNMRPADNNIGFWREFVSEYFAPHARKRWCLSQYSAGNGRQSTGVFPQDLWRCEICGSNPGRGFEASVEVMPRLFKTKYDNGEQEELLFVDLPYEYKLSSGLIVLEYGKAVQESVFEQLRVVWDGQLRIIFTPELKILSWDFCARNHEELLPRRSVVPQVNQLVTLASKYQSALAQTNGAGLSAQELQTNCNMFVSSARQLVRSLEPPSVNEIGFTKRFVRCIQIAEVVNSMKDLIDFSLENNMGPIESLQRFPHGGSVSGEVPCLPMQSEPAGNAPFVTEENAIILNSIQSSVDKEMNSNLHRPLKGHVNPLLSVQSLLRHNSSSPQSFIQNDPSVMGTLSGTGSLSNSLQASPTSSLTSFQTSISSLTGNPQPPLGGFQTSLPPNSGNPNAMQQSSLPPLQGSQQNTNNAVQHLFHDTMNPQSSSGGIFHHGNTGNAGINNGPVNGMASGLTAFPLGINSGNIGGLGGIGSSMGGNIGVGSGLNIANRLRHLDSLSQMGNIGSPHTLGNRLKFVSLASQHDMQLQENNLQKGFGLGGNSDFGNHSFNWK